MILVEIIYLLPAMYIMDQLSHVGPRRLVYFHPTFLKLVRTSFLSLWLLSSRALSQWQICKYPFPPLIPASSIYRLEFRKSLLAPLAFHVFPITLRLSFVRVWSERWSAMGDSRVPPGHAPHFHYPTAAIIKRIRLENFMCHSNLEMEFGEWVNFITGQNGSQCLSSLTFPFLEFGSEILLWWTVLLLISCNWKF